MTTYFKHSAPDMKALERANDRDISFGNSRINADALISPASAEAFYRFNDLAAAGSAWGQTWPSAGNGVHRMTPI